MRVSIPEIVAYDTEAATLRAKDTFVFGVGAGPRLCIHEGTGSTPGSVRATVLSEFDVNITPGGRYVIEFSGNELVMPVNTTVVATPVD